MKPLASLVQPALCALTLGASLLAACGGRYQTVREVLDDPAGAGSSSGGATSTGRGGSAPSGNAGSSSAGSSHAGSPNAAAGSVGTGSAGSGGGGACSTVKCGVVLCPGGLTPVIAPGQCCATSCGSTCPPCVQCPAGTHAESLPGVCCGSCVDDRDVACKKGQEAYAVDREAILTKYRYGCASSQECVTLAPSNSCEQGCSYAAVWYGVADSLESNLSHSADTYCTSCKQGPIPPCEPPPMVGCINGSCQFQVK